jgi:hypothetical protein
MDHVPLKNCRVHAIRRRHLGATEANTAHVKLCNNRTTVLCSAQRTTERMGESDVVHQLNKQPL